MKVVILGCGRMGAMVATHLSAAGHEISIIDYDSSQFQRLGDDYAGKKIVGNGTEQDTLRRAGIERADAFLAITQGDNRNIMASQIAKVIFDVPRVHTRIKDPLRAECFALEGLETFCTTILASSYVERTILGDAGAEFPGEGALAAEMIVPGKLAGASGSRAEG